MSEWVRSVDNTCDDDQVIRLSLRKNQVAFVVDLDRPLHKQLEGIARSARDRQSELPAPPKLSRQSTHFSKYLRILDARDAAANRATIESTLFPDLENEYPERQRSKTFDNFERAARRLRDGGYRELVTA